MKKYWLLICLGMAMPIVSMAQDTIRYGDPYIMFHDSVPLKKMYEYSADEPCGYYPTLMAVFTADSNTILYGVGTTLCDYSASHAYLGEDAYTWVQLYSYRTVVLVRDGNTSSSEIIMKDSVVTPQYATQYSTQTPVGDLKKRVFQYQFYDGTVRNAVVSEVYFARPIDVSGRRFYVAREALDAVTDISSGVPQKYFPGFLMYATDTTCSQKWYYDLMDNEFGKGGSFMDLTSDRKWGAYFPIIGLRCSAPPKPSCMVDDGEVVMTWHDDFLDTAAWQLSIGADKEHPEVNQLVDMQQGRTVYIHESAPAEGEVWYARLRRACRYKTSGYDTVVWSEWSKATVIGAAGIVEAEQGAKFEVNPNPTEGKVTLRMEKGLVAAARLTVTDLTGREVLTTMVSAGAERYTLDMGSLPKGAYLLRLTSEQGMATRKVVKR